MKRALPPLTTWVILLAMPTSAGADEAKAEDPAHNELRKVRDGINEAFKKRDFDGLVSFMHSDVVITWQNGEVTRKRDGAKAYYQKMLTGPDSIVESMTYDLVVDEVAIIHGGDTAVAWGTLGDKYKLRDGMEVTMNSRWSATLVKEGDQWLVASAHGSVNAFDNDILRQVAKKTMLYFGGGGLALGLIVGVCGTWLLRRKKQPA